jgi:four helix bundle protein
MTYQHSFRTLIAWKEAKSLCIEIYRITDKFPKTEMYGLTSQLRRASSSIMANIAEGNNRTSKKEKQRFWNIAFASLCEVDNFMELSKELQFCNELNHKKSQDQLNKTGYLLSRLHKSQTR